MAIRTETVLKHTPGPWRYEPTRDNAATTRQMIDEPIGGSIMADDSYLARIWSDAENPMADALLMAAAPELLGLAHGYLAYLHAELHSGMSEDDFESHPLVVAIRAVIKRATGE